MFILNLLKRTRKEEIEVALLEDILERTNQEMLDKNQKMIDEMRRIQNEDTQNR